MFSTHLNLPALFLCFCCVAATTSNDAIASDDRSVLITSQDCLEINKKT